jgi:hypothetical protein
MYDGHMTSLTRLTVNLTPKSAASLDESATMEELSRTDIVNRALQLYTFFARQQREGATIYMKRPNEEELERIRIL